MDLDIDTPDEHDLPRANVTVPRMNVTEGGRQPICALNTKPNLYWENSMLSRKAYTEGTGGQDVLPSGQGSSCLSGRDSGRRNDGAHREREHPFLWHTIGGAMSPWAFSLCR